MTLVVILAGGAGRRMGGNKPFSPFGQTTLIEAVIERLKPQSSQLYVNAGHRTHPLATAFHRLELPLIFDQELASLGPLSGVLSALKLATQLHEDYVVTAPCDVPFLPLNLVDEFMAPAPSDVAFLATGRDHPLCARWHASVLDRLHTALSEAALSGGLSVMAFIETLPFQRITIENEAAMMNINRPEDR